MLFYVSPSLRGHELIVAGSTEKPMFRGLSAPEAYPELACLLACGDLTDAGIVAGLCCGVGWCGSLGHANFGSVR